jgi:hypothetical protein
MTHSIPILIAAGLNEIISVLVGLAFFVIWVINQINDAKKKQAAQAPRPQPGLPPQGAEQAAAGAPPPDPLRAQVDEFLRRAGKQPAAAPAPSQPGATRPRQPAGRDEVVVLLDESVATPPRKTLAEKMRAQIDAANVRRAKPTASQQPRDSKPRPPQRVAPQPRAKSVGEHVAERIGASAHEFNKEVADLGARVKQADEQFDRQLQQKFDHELGSLASRPATSNSETPPTTQRPSPAAQIAAMLANPDGVRQAMILNEILHRPSDRW